MRSFLQHLLVFLFGAAVGAGVVLTTQPGFSLVVTTLTPVTSPAPVPIAGLSPAVPATPVVRTAQVAAATPVTPVPVRVDVAAVAQPAPGLDFAALSERPVFWPPSVTLTTATSVPLFDGARRAGELPLAVGAVLQVSKVLTTGMLEARAQGQKFEIDGKLTDLETQVRRKVQEMVERDDKTLAPFLRGALAGPSVAAVPASPASAPAPEVSKSAAKPVPVTFDDKLNVLFGRKPAPVEPASAAVPSSAPPVVSPPEAKATEGQDKKADLDRRMNGLFGTPAK